MKRWLFSFLILLLVLLAFAPQLLSLAIKMGASSKIRAESISLSWFSTQRAERLELFDDRRQLIFSCHHLATSTSLWDLLIWKLNPVQTSSLIPSFLDDTAIDGGDLAVHLSGYNTVSFKEVQLQLKLPKENTPLELVATGKANQGHFNIFAKLDPGHIEAEAKLIQFPLIGLEESIDLELHAAISEKQIELALQATSPQFSAFVQAESQDHTLVLTKPATLKGTLTPLLAQKLSAYIPQLNAFPLKEIQTVNVEVLSLSLPFHEKKPDYGRLAIQADLLARGVQFEKLAIDTLQAKASTDQLSRGIDIQSRTTLTFKEQIDIALQGTFSPQESHFTLQAQSEHGSFPKASFTWKEEISLDAPLILTYLPPDFQAPLELAIEQLTFPSLAQWERMSLQAVCICPFPSASIGEIRCRIAAPTLDRIHLDIEGSTLQTAIDASWNLHTLAIRQPILIDYLLDHKELERFHVSIDTPTKIKIELEPFQIDNFDWSTLKLKGRARTDAVTLTNQLTVENALLDFIWNVKEKKCEAELSAQVEKGSLSAAVTLNQCALYPLFDIKGAHLHALVDLKNVSSRLFGRYAPLIGDQIDLHLEIEADPDFWCFPSETAPPKSQTFALKATSSQLNIDTTLIVEDHLLRLKKQPAEIHFTLTDQAYTIFDQLSPFQFTDSPAIHLVLSQLRCQISPPWQIDWSSLEIKGEAHMETCIFSEKTTSQPITIKDFALAFDRSKAGGPIEFSLASGLIAERQKGEVSIVGKIDEIASKSHLKADLSANFVKFPPIIFDLLARAGGNTDSPFSALFGDSFDASLTAQLQDLSGPVHLNLHSPNTRVSLDGQLASGVLTLSESIHAQITMTPEISNLFLNEINPLSISDIASKDPITLEIGAAGFSCPVYPFIPSQLHIPRLHLELGRISCRNEGNIRIALGLLKSYQLEKNEELHLWFTPIDCQIRAGEIDWERTEILVADTYEIALWGKIDLVKDKVNMILGLTASCLKKAFGIKDLPENYVLQIPMKGKLDDVRINTGKATTKIALLLAWQQKDVAGAIGGGPAGAAIGGLLNKMGAIPDFKAKAPPAKRPFPWDKPKKETSQENKKAIKKDDKPLKQILKILR